MTRSIILALLLVVAFAQAGAQDTALQAKPAKNYKNVVRYNISGPLFFGAGYVVLGYERVFKNNRQSMSLNAGQAVLPKVVDFMSEGATLEGTSDNKGLNFALDYRFYLQKENKYLAPRGVYIGPYYSFTQFSRTSDWKLEQAGNTSFANTKSDFNINTLGFELGYQFVFWKRVTLDLVLIGPGISNYKLKSTFDSNLTQEQKDQLLNAVQEMIANKFPGMDYVIGDASFDAKGNLSTWNLGYRYIMNIGFRF